MNGCREKAVHKCQLRLSWLTKFRLRSASYFPEINHNGLPKSALCNEERLAFYGRPFKKARNRQKVSCADGRMAGLERTKIEDLNVNPSAGYWCPAALAVLSCFGATRRFASDRDRGKRVPLDQACDSAVTISDTTHSYCLPTNKNSAR